MSYRVRLIIAWSTAAILPLGGVIWLLIDHEASPGVIPLLVGLLLFCWIGEKVMRILPIKQELSPPNED